MRIDMLHRADAMLRLANLIQSHAAEFLRRSGVAFEVRWHGVLSHLSRYGPSSVTELSAALGVSHPAVHQTAKTLLERGLIGAYRDARDKRRRVLALTRAGKARLAGLRDVFVALEDESQDLFGPRLLALAEGEDEVVIRILDFAPELAGRFAELNREWIEQYFHLEAADEAVFASPESYIVQPGGAIVFAERADTQEIVGTCALQIHGPQLGELAKMAVTPSAQGLGAGRQLANAVIERARAKGVRRLFLDTNSVLKPAISLYKSLGFVQLEREDSSRYARSDTYMELLLGD